MWDYEKVGGPWTGEEWVGTNHKRLVHHISRSAIEWSKAVETTNSCRDIEESVLHAILAHHGRREYGSPVAPNSRLAWILHLSDQMSARMNDCDTNDMIRPKE
jgi:3'-5' exoribonuclease